MHATPENMAGSKSDRERRERPRQAVSILTYVSLDDANGGMMVNISETGMAISSAEELGDIVSHKLRFQLPRIDRTFETTVEVIWTSESEKNAGVRFSSLSVDDRLQIRNWIKDELFAEAFPSRAAVRAVPRRNLNFSYETLKGPDSAVEATPIATTPVIARKALRDLPADLPEAKSREFDRLFPSERTLPAEPAKREEKFARLASATTIETTAYWMNFPSEREYPSDEAHVAAGQPHAESALAADPKAAGSDVDAAVPIATAAAVNLHQVEAGSQQAAVVLATTTPAEEAHIEAAGDAGALEAIAAEPVGAFPSSESAGTVAAEPVNVADKAPNAPPELSEPEIGLPATVNEIAIPEEMIAGAPSVAAEAPLEETGELPIHELNPAPEGPEFAASRLDLLDISDAVRKPGRFSGGAVSDASIESLLAIAQEEEAAAPHSKSLQLVPEKKSAFASSRTARVPAKTVASALPHVALRSASQQFVPAGPLADGDKKFRGLAVAASVVLLALCFAIGYSSHFRPTWSATSAQASGSEAPSAANGSGVGEPAATPAQPAATQTSLSVSEPVKNSAPSPKLPDSSSVPPNPNFKTPALPAAVETPPASFFPVTAPSEGSTPRMVELPETTVFDSPKVLIRLRQFFFVPPQPGPEWSHSLERISIGESTAKMPPPPVRDADAGVVHIRATIGEDGAVKNVRPLNGPVSLIPQSVDAIRRWRYQPSALDGQPMEWQGDFTIEFRPGP
jgi:hypothetical protein